MENKRRYFSGIQYLLIILTLIFFNRGFTQGTVDVFNDHHIQPEVWHFSGYPKGEVDNKGDLNLSIPVMTVPGRNGLNFDINFSYHAPIQKSQKASWIGLGWNFDPGSITRDPQGTVRTHRQQALWDLPETVDFAEAVDTQPDIYFLSLPGLGTHPFSRSNQPVFYETYLENNDYEPLNRDQFYFHTWKPWRIEIDTMSAAQINSTEGWTPHGVFDHYGGTSMPEIYRFTVTTDDGMRYIFGRPTLSQYKCPGYDDPAYYISTWRLIAILSPECPEDSLYPGGGTPGNWIRFEYRFDSTNVTKKSSGNSSNITHNTYLYKVVTPTHYAVFESTPRTDVDDNASGFSAAFKNLNAIHLFRTGGSDTLKSVYLAQDKELCTISGNGKTTLQEIIFKGKHRKFEPGYKFDYDSLNPLFSDINENDAHDDDFGYYDTGDKSSNYDANINDGKAWSLKTIYYPTGGSATFEYENDEMFADFTNQEEVTLSFEKLEYIFDQEEYGYSVAYYDFDDGSASKFHQGGTRVKKIIRKHANGDTVSVESYAYYNGLPTSIPPLYFANKYGYFGYFSPGNRGTAAVIYNVVVKYSSDGTMEIRHYKVPDFVQDNGSFVSMELITGYYIFEPAESCTYVMGNDDIKWGHLITTETINTGYGITSKTSYNISSYQTMSLALDYLYQDEGRVPVKWVNLLVDTTHTTVNDFKQTTRYEYNNGPRLKSKTIETGSRGEERVTEVLYAHEVSSYGGNSVHPDSLSEMRAANMLSQVAQQTNYTVSAGQDTAYNTSSVTQWAEFLIADAGYRWKPSKAYAWNKTAPQASRPAFTAWTGTPSSDWLRSVTYNSYGDYGRPIQVTDGMNNTTDLYYGDNNNNFNNYSSSNGLAHAYLTGIERNGLQLAYDYNPDNGQVSSMTDPNGQSIEYYYDSFGRLAGATNADGLVVNEYSYFIHDSLTGDQKSYIETLSYPCGNYFRNGSFEINNKADVEFWGSYANADTNETDAVTGNSYLNLKYASADYQYYIYLDSSKTYIFSAWAKKAAGSSTTVKFRLDGLGNKYQLLNQSTGSAIEQNAGEIEFSKTVSSSSWERIWFKFKSTDDCTIDFSIDGTGSNEIVIDDIILAPTYQHVSDATFPSHIEPLVQIAFHDDLGRNGQSIISAGPYLLGQQIIQHYDYDSQDRKIKEWKPFPSSKSAASSALTSYEPLAADSNSSRSAYDYYDGTSAPDAEGYPYSRYFFAVGSDYLAYIFPPGKAHHLPENIDPFNYPPVTPHTDIFYITNKLWTNSSTEVSSYAANTLQKKITVDEDKFATAVFTDRFGNDIRQVSYEKSTGDAIAQAQAFADIELGQSIDEETIQITAIEDDTISVYWHAFFFGGGQSLPEGWAYITVTREDETVIHYDLSDEEVEDTLEVTAEAGETIYFTVKALEDFSTPTGKSYVTSYVKVTYSGYSLESYIAKNTDFKYDGAGNLVKVMPPNYFNPPTGSDSTDWVTAYTYNTLGRLTRKKTPDAGTVRYSYNANGYLITQRDSVQYSAGEATYHAYDFAGRLLKTEEGTDTQLNLVAQYQYDTAPDTASSPWNTYSFDEDSSNFFKNGKGRLTASAYKSDGAWQIALYNYDDNGRVAQKAVYSNSLDKVLLTYRYNAQGALLETGSFYRQYSFYHYYVYDNFGNLAKVLARDDTLADPAANTADAAYVYDQTGKLAAYNLLEYSSGSFRDTVDYSYHIRDWISGIGDVNVTGNPFSAAYTYQPNGNISAAEFYNGALSEPHYKYDFSFDSQKRLSGADYSYKSGSWSNVNRYDVSSVTYDDNGNILSLQRRKEGSGSLVDNLTYNYGNDNNQLTSLSDAVG
ncbi:MAG: hypothetical protein KDH97_01485, partial [Calditrichaeota bacterium]|nr:hypothetical protein [Calditrichota bacterium]